MSTTYQEDTYGQSSGGSDQLEEFARSLMLNAISSTGVSFHPGARAELEQLITQGISQMRLKQHQRQPEKLIEAQQNLIQYIARIGEYARNYNLGSVDTLPSAVKLEFCPVYPFK